MARRIVEAARVVSWAVLAGLMVAAGESRAEAQVPTGVRIQSDGGIQSGAETPADAEIQPGSGQYHRPPPHQPQVVFEPVRPSTEVGVGLGLWSLMDHGGDSQARVTRLLNEIVGFDLAVHTGRSGPAARRYGLLVAAVRLGPPPELGRPRGYLLAGVGLGSGLTYSVSPMIGAGVAHPQAFGSTWVEVVVFQNGLPLRDRGQVSFGLSIAFD